MYQVLIIAVICAIGTAPGPLAAAATAAPKCKANEVLLACSHPDNVCGKPVPLFCSLLCGPKACRCRPGFARNAAGQCVANSLCKPKPPQRSIIPKCKVNEAFVLCSRPEATCAIPKPKLTPVGAPKCQCKPGFVRFGVSCILLVKCPTTSTSTRTSTTTTTTTTTTPTTTTTTPTTTTVTKRAIASPASSGGNGSAAKTDCNNNAAHVVTVSDASENDFVKQLFQAEQASTKCAAGPSDACLMWTGLERGGTNAGDFWWVDTTPFLPSDYKNWASGEPNFWDGTEYCVEMYNDGAWNDISCGGRDPRRIWMCEKDANVGHSG